jgi:hypothetical protein
MVVCLLLSDDLRLDGAAGLSGQHGLARLDVL